MEFYLYGLPEKLKPCCRYTNADGESFIIAVDTAKNEFSVYPFSKNKVGKRLGVSNNPRKLEERFCKAKGGGED